MINFSAIVAATTHYNMHTHTQFCDGHDTMEHFVLAALDKGFTHLGFTPHGPVTVPSPCNMSWPAVADYLAQIESLRAQYGDRIAIYAGMEVDYIDDEQFCHNDLLALPLDYRIGSVHFIPSFDNADEYVDIDGHYDQFIQKMHAFFHDDVEAVVRSFFAQSMRMVEAGGFDVVGHFDKIGFNASMFCPGIDTAPWYDELVMRLFEAIMDHHYVIEVNTKAWHDRHRFYPNERYFGMLRRYRPTVLVNSDAHYPDRLNSGRDEALSRLAKA